MKALEKLRDMLNCPFYYKPPLMWHGREYFMTRVIVVYTDNVVLYSNSKGKEIFISDDQVKYVFRVKNDQQIKLKNRYYQPDGR